MHHRSKEAVIRDIERTRGDVPRLWGEIRAKNPLTLAKQAAVLGFLRWRSKAKAKTHSADRKLRRNPYAYIGGAVALGAVTTVLIRKRRARRARLLIETTA